MAVLSLLQASQTEGAPSRQMLTKLAKDIPRPDFIIVGENGKYKINTDCESWADYLKNARTRKTASTSAENGGTAVNRKKLLGIDKRTKPQAEPDAAPQPKTNKEKKLSRDKSENGISQYSQDEIQNAVAEQEIQEARIKKYKADQEEIKLKNALGQFADIDTVRYYVSFFQRVISDVFAVPKTISKEIKHLYIADRDREAEEFSRMEIERTVSNIIKNLLDELNGETKADD
jgi:hypothetical protein